MIIEKATLSDIDLLIQLRIDFLRHEYKLAEKEIDLLNIQLKDYFTRHLQSGDFIAYFIRKENVVLSTAFLIIQERPANPAFISGLSGTILNVYTYPAYRKNGYSTLLLKKIIEDAHALKLSNLELHATGMGKSIYEKLGFKIMPYTPMHMSL